VTITQEQFDSLLTWLDEDRDVAGRTYETIRSGLVRIFVSKGFSDAEDLADETINRVMVRLRDIRATYTGRQANYFLGVARNIIRERRRRREIAGGVIDDPVAPPPKPDPEHDCLGYCLDRLPVSKRDLILSYYLYDGHDKIEHHKQMAGQLNLSEGAVRSRAFQIRVRLENCMRQCPLLKQGRRCPWSSVVKADQPRQVNVRQLPILD
jgi:RNA polymerase sigma factor (sigma-70 family)